MRQLMRLTTFLLIFFSFIVFAQLFSSEKHRFEIEPIAQNLVHPWSFAFLPDGKILVTERGGKLLLIDKAGQNRPISGLPKINAYGQGGLLDVVLDPDYINNNQIYLSYAGKQGKNYGTEVLRATFNGEDKLDDVRVIFRQSDKTNSSRHFGSRMLFDKDGHLFITLGDRADRPRAQSLSDHAGSLIRIDKEGGVPQDNPFVADNRALPEIYTYGNRNIQGIAMHPITGELYTHEHGPQGGDEINRMVAGANYGWPIVTYGVNYGIGTKIGEGVEKEGMTPSIHYWVPSIAPSGMTFYNGDQFPNWQGNLFVGSLKFGQLVRLVMEDGKIVDEERMLTGKIGRIRDVRQGPDGLLYLLTDQDRGLLVRLVPEK